MPTTPTTTAKRRRRKRGRGGGSSQPLLIQQQKQKHEKHHAANDDDDNDDDDNEQQVEQTVTTFPYRNNNNNDLYAFNQTIHCAYFRRCIPCAYKICNFDVALDTQFCRVVSNQRSEMCKRIIMKSMNNNNNTIKEDTTTDTTPNQHEEGLLGYKPGMNVLTLGDGDFSFSLAVARLIFKKKKNNSNNNSTNSNNSSILIATSYESKDTLLKVYDQSIVQTLKELKQLGATVLFEIDATKDFRCTTTLLQQQQQQQHEPINNSININTNKIKFDRIVWNFPCSAVGKGQDGQNSEMELNKSLVKQFINNNAVHILEPHLGQIHMSHKTKPPFNQWNIEQVVVTAGDDGYGDEHNSSDNSSSKSDGDQATTTVVRYCGRVVLDRYLFPPYVPRKALDRKSFSCHDACTYIFDMVPAEEEKDVSGDGVPSRKTIKKKPNPLVESCCCASSSTITTTGATDDRSPSPPPQPAVSFLEPVTKELIQSIRARLLVAAATTARNNTKKKPSVAGKKGTTAKKRKRR